MKDILIKALCLLPLLICSCSQTTVHLYTLYLTNSEIKAINKKLLAANFTVKPNQLAFPKSVVHSSLIYSPTINDRNAVRDLMESMNDLGWAIHSSSMLFTGNHWYKENSIALMLVPENIDPQAKTNQQYWAYEYTSQNCERQLIVNLERNGQYQISSTEHIALQDEYAMGKWSITHFPYVELKAKSSEWRSYFELDSDIQTDKIGQIQVYKLSPLSDDPILNNCEFIYGVRM